MLNQQKGFSLIELIMSLAIMAIGVLLFVQHEQHQMRMALAKVTGKQLFEYHNAIKSYAISKSLNPTGIATGTFTGVDWLKDSSCGGTASTSFLRCDFQEITPFGKLSFEATVSTATTPAGEELISITSNTTPFTYGGIPRGDLAGVAAISASGQSSLFTPVSASFGNISSDPSTAKITMTAYNSPVAQSVWLKVDGSNPMEGKIRFSSPNDEERNLNGVNRITAEDGGSLILGGGILSGKFISEYDTEIFGKLQVQDNLNVQGDSYTLGSIYADGSITSEGNISADGDLTASIDLDSGNDITVGLSMSAQKDLVVDNDLTAGKNIFVREDITVGQNLVSGGSLHADNGIYGDAIHADGDIIAGTNIEVGENLEVGGTLEAQDDIIGAKGLEISGDSILKGRLFARNNVSLQSDVLANMDLSILGRLTVDGETKISGNSTFSKAVKTDELDGNLTIRTRVSSGGGCSPIGRIGTDSAGNLLSCVSGKWKRVASLQPNKIISGSFTPPHEGCSSRRIADSSYQMCTFTGHARVAEREYIFIYKSGGSFYIRGCRGGWTGTAYYKCLK
ncbi:prepilin-type N-terminal cleavage/methylation domain-containing protein [Neptuniibacter sp. QD37_11]|uniref:prepilin-type N-terminal cleavage/methylation domain-containing protein n=1 Tax=Neptuniibacter sp. QD37_11 TaxID=3398209 RepID=UPI0039F57148